MTLNLLFIRLIQAYELLNVIVDKTYLMTIYSVLWHNCRAFSVMLNVLLGLKFVL